MSQRGLRNIHLRLPNIIMNDRHRLIPPFSDKQNKKNLSFLLSTIKDDTLQKKYSSILQRKKATTSKVKLKYKLEGSGITDCPFNLVMLNRVSKYCGFDRNSF